jgi:hypothetical protein
LKVHRSSISLSCDQTGGGFRQPLEIYSLRWEIEHLFQCLKGRGFHWEETRLTRYFRIKKVMALLAMAFCWAHKTGAWKHKAIKPLKIS